MSWHAKAQIKWCPEFPMTVLLPFLALIALIVLGVLQAAIYVFTGED